MKIDINNGFISLKTIETADYPGFAELKLLYTRAFPPDERRDSYELDKMLNNDSFSFLMISHYDKPAGLIAFWLIEDYAFIEHLVVTEQFRNRKIGETAVHLLNEALQLPLLLETEHPTEEISKSRLGFYERQGFMIVDADYIQPAYHPEKKPVEMLLLSNQTIEKEKLIALVKSIHKLVYGVI